MPAASVELAGLLVELVELVDSVDSVVARVAYVPPRTIHVRI